MREIQLFSFLSEQKEAQFQNNGSSSQSRQVKNSDLN